MDEQIVKKLFEVIDKAADYRALLLLDTYVSKDALITAFDLHDERQEAFHAMRVASDELQRMLTLQVST